MARRDDRSPSPPPSRLKPERVQEEPAYPSDGTLKPERVQGKPAEPAQDAQEREGGQRCSGG